MHSEDTEISEFDQYQNSDNAPFIIYAGLECKMQIFYGCKNNPESSSTAKVREHIPSGSSISTIRNESN